MTGWDIVSAKCNSEASYTRPIRHLMPDLHIQALFGISPETLSWGKRLTLVLLPKNQGVNYRLAKK